MPNRVLRDWTDSETIDILSVHAERFFTRLIMKVDDYGRYSANVKYLKSTLFPLKTDVREPDITRWITECSSAGLILTYNIAQKDYLQIENFKQVLRQKREKYPAPVMHSTCVADAAQTDSICVPETKGKETESETESEGQKLPIHTPEEILGFENFQNWIKAKAPMVAKMKEPFSIEQFIQLKKDFNTEVITDMLIKMHNYKPLLQKNISANLTFRNWVKRDFNFSGSNKEQVTNGPTHQSIAEKKAREILNA